MTIEEILAKNSKKTSEDREFEKRIIFRNLGVGSDGVGYVSVVGFGDSSSEEKIKNLKMYGFRYNGLVKLWINETPAPGVDCHRVDFNKFIEYGFDKRYHMVATAKHDIVRMITPFMKNKQESTGFVGGIGERISLDVTLVGGSVIPSDSDFGDLQLLIFKDGDGHRISWLQRGYSIETVRLFMKKFKTDTVNIVGTVKKHATRLGLPTTDLSRCEVCVKGHTLLGFAKVLREKKNTGNEG